MLRTRPNMTLAVEQGRKTLNFDLNFEPVAQSETGLSLRPFREINPRNAIIHGHTNFQTCHSRENYTWKVFFLFLKVSEFFSLMDNCFAQ